jgi:hypothetical protein
LSELVEDEKHQDISFLAGETGFDPQRIVWLVQAAVCEKQSKGVEARLHTHVTQELIPAAVFYGWFRLGLPTEPSALWATPTDTLITTLNAAIAQGVIPLSSSASLKVIGRRSEQFKLDRVLQSTPPYSASSLGDLLATLPVPLNLDQQRVIAGVVTDLRPDDPQLVNRIADVAGFDGDAVGVARTLRLGALTGGHLPLARALQLRLQHDEEREGGLRPLATLRPDEWLDLAYTHGTPEGPGITPVAYANALAAGVEQQHPTAALAAHLMGARRLAQHPLLTDVGTFLGDNPDFDIVTANLNAITVRTNVSGVARPEQLVEGLRTLQRIQSLGATWEETATLLENDLYSPHQLLAAGPTQLGDMLQGQLAPERVMALYNQAEELHNVTFAAFTAAFSSLSGPRILPNQFGFVPGGGDPSPDSPGGIVHLNDVNALFQSRGGAFDPTRYKFPPPVRTGLIPGKNPEVNFGPAMEHQPTLAALFGSQDACACGHCNSVLSPAAYFVDVLQFIKNALPNNELLHRLLLRRPDLQDVELSCNNTNTEVPAIDLALEVLENSVALPFDVELSAGSEVEAQLSGSTVGAAVKTALEKTVRSRSLLGEVNAAREGEDWTVVDAHRRWKLNAQNAAALKAGTQTLDTTGLDMSALIAALNRGQVARGAEAAFARLFAPNQKQPPDLTNYALTITPLSAGESWRVEYQLVAELLSDDASQVVLQTTAGVVWRDHSYGQATVAAIEYDLSKSTVPALLQGVLASSFYKAPTFIVKQARTDRWTLVSDTLELTLRFVPARLTVTSLAYQSGDADTDALAWPENHNPEAYVLLKGAGAVFPWSLPVDLPLEEVRLFLERARSSRRRLIELTTPFDRRLRESSPFALEVLGLSEAEARLITQSPLDIYECWGLSSDQTMIRDAAAGGILKDASSLSLLQTVSILLQQSRLGFEEMREVLATRFVEGDAPPLVIVPQSTCKPSEMKIPSLVIGHLDRIHRFVRLRRRLGWSVAELDTAVRLATGAALNQTTLLYLADVVRIGEMLDLPIAAVLAWYGTTAAAAHNIRELAGALGQTVDELRHAQQLLGVADVFATPGETLKFCERVKDFGRGGVAFEDLRYLLQHHETEGTGITLSAAQLKRLAVAARDAVRSIPGPPEKVPPLPADDDESIATALATRLARENAAIAALATGLDASHELVDDLLRTRLRYPPDAAKAAVGLFLETSFLDGDLSQPSGAAVESVLVRLYKTVFLWKSLKLSPSQLQWLRRSTADKNGLSALDFNTLPLASLPAPANVEGFEQLLALARLGSLLPRADDFLHRYAALDFTDGATEEHAQHLLAVGLNVESNEVIAAAKQLHITSANQFDQYRDPRRLIRLMELLIALKQLGAAMEMVSPAAAPPPAAPNGLASPSPNELDADLARGLLHNKYGESRWHELIKPIADKLRERQRDALVDYLVGRDARPRDGDANPRIFTGDRVRDANDLYERYLIDVQSGSCLKTTRLLQAIAAAQLFVQRVLLNLEKGVSLGEDKRKLWDWMHSYRVWEANRKVFLFPENWLLPELRDDKTAIFGEMESALTQSEPSAEITGAALTGYLEDLDELAQISVIAMYEDRREAGTKQQPKEERTLYVVGRTPNQPFRYFWRSCAKFGNAAEMSWSGWEALDIDNADDYLMPFIFDGDLHIAWPIFRKTIDEKTRELLWEVQIAWTRRASRRWIKRKIGDQSLTLPRLMNKTELNSFAFRLRTDGKPVNSLKDSSRESVYIDCYSAHPEAPDPSAIDPTQFPTDLAHVGNPVSNWVNVNLTLVVRCFGHYKISGVDVYEYLNDVDMKVEYPYGYWGGGIESKTFPSTGLSRVDGISVIPLTVRNTANVTVSFSRTKSDGRIDSKSPPGAVLRDSNTGEYPVWVWNLTVVFELLESTRGNFNPNRQVVFKNAGYFLMDTLHDISAVRKTSAEQLPLLLPGAKVAGNAFTLSDATDRLPLPPNRSTQLDKGTTGALTLVPAVGSGDGRGVWYLRDGVTRCYLDIGGRPAQAWPDGQDFVRSYRRLRAAEKFTELFDPSTQAMGRDGRPAITTALPPTVLGTTLPSISFDRSTPYANYNWELFLHAPLAIADYLAGQMRFDDARLWLHAVFDPTTEKKDNETHQIPQFWRFLPFANDTRPEAIATLLTWLADPTIVDPKDTTEIESKLKTNIEEWKKNPFMPHLIARLRPSAYQWYTFFSYLNVLIGWADQLFRRDTRESVNEATLLYVFAAKLLGPRPRTIPPPTPPPPQTYRSLQTGVLDEFSNAWLKYADLPGVQKLIKGSGQARALSLAPMTSGNGGTSITLERPPTTGHQILTSLSAPAFCIPQNEKLTEFYDRVEDRLFNVRHCRNIDGVFRDLPLYDPPIDPLLLIRARAAGLDIESVLNDPSAPLPNYRFTFTLQKALELCAELKALGAALLAALEKQDSEELTLLRSRHEVSVLKLVRDTRRKQLDESEANIAALHQSEETILERLGQYQKLLGKPGITKGQDGMPVVEQSSALAVSTDAVGEVSGLGLIPKELSQLKFTAAANEFTQQANSLHVLAGILSMIPNIWAGDALVAGQTFGGANLGSGVSAIAKAIEMGAVEANYFANQMGTFGGYERRQDEWVHQSKLALAELKQIQKQILAAEIRKDIAERELSNHDTQIENAREVEDFLLGKFTGRQLFRWMSSQIAEVYFRTYQLTLDQARRAESAYLHELGLDNSARPFVQAGHWDSLKRGLLAGEHLHHDLKRMESAYLERNVREFEINKNVSLLQLDPVELIALKETGACEFNVPELLFDFDYPGHYMRRIRMVSLSIPCIAGPYASVSATLRMTKSEIRAKPTAESPYGSQGEHDPRFTKTAAAIKAIVTSSAQQDSGMFEPNLRDERYLPFEGAGVISSWKLELPNAFRSFDYSTISDVILHLRYTARDGGSSLKEAAVSAVTGIVTAAAAASAAGPGLSRLFSLRHEFPTEWYRFLNQVDRADGSQSLEFKLTHDRFPLPFRDRTIRINGADVFLKLKDVSDPAAFDEPGNTQHTALGAYMTSTRPLTLSIVAPPPSVGAATPQAFPLVLNSAESSLNGLPHGVPDFGTAARTLGNWSLKIESVNVEVIAQSLRYAVTANGISHWRVKSDLIQDIFIVCRYSV